MFNRMIVLLILITTLCIKESLSRCTEGKVRLVNTFLKSHGIVEVCLDSNWGRICRDGWDRNDAAVVCTQLGYGPQGAIPTLWGGQTSNRPDILLENVNCVSSKKNLLQCSYNTIRRDQDRYNCLYDGYAGVRCRDEQLRVMNVSAATVDTPHCTKHTAILISWELYSGAPHSPSSFTVECFNQLHNTILSVNNGTFMQISVGGLLSSTSYNCCVSAIYFRTYETERRCTSTDVLQSDSVTSPALRSNDRANLIGGVLGFIIVVLVLLLTICVGALLYLLRSRGVHVIPKRSPQSDNNSTEMPIGRNISYVTAPSRTSGSQSISTVDQGGAAAEYSRIGPSYETTVNSRRQQPVDAGRNQVSAGLAERYEFSETHLALAGGSGGVQGEEAMDYEIPLQSGEHEEYSRLQH